MLSNLVPTSVSLDVITDALYLALRKWSSLLERCTSILHRVPLPSVHRASSLTERPNKFLSLLWTITSETVNELSSIIVCSISWHTSLSSAIASKNTSSIGRKSLIFSILSSSVILFHLLSLTVTFSSHHQYLRFSCRRCHWHKAVYHPIIFCLF